jgi:hypothetical protein
MVSEIKYTDQQSPHSALIFYYLYKMKKIINRNFLCDIWEFTLQWIFVLQYCGLFHKQQQA